MKLNKTCITLTAAFIVGIVVAGNLSPKRLNPTQCQTIKPFSGCKAPIEPTKENCNLLAKRNTPPFVFTRNSSPICLGPSEILQPLAKLGVCQVFDQNGTASQCDNQLLMGCLKKRFFPAPVWPVKPERFGEFTNPHYRNTPASNAEVCFWHDNGKGSWPVALHRMQG